VRRVAAIALAAVTAMTAGPRAGGQTLDLAPPPALPSLAEDNAVTRLARTVQEEIRSLERERAATEGREATVLAARIALRTVAFDLLARGGTEPLERSVLAMEGLRLADLRRSLDTALDGEFAASAPPRPMRSRDRIVRGLERFAEIAPRAMAAPGLGEVGALDAALATALRPLVDAVAVMSGLEGAETLGTGWPSLAAPTNRDRRAETPDLAARANACPWLLPEERAAIAAEVAAIAEGGSDEALRLVRARTQLAATLESLGEDGRKRLERLEPSVVDTVRRALVAAEPDRERLGVERLARAVARMNEPLRLAASTERLADGLPRDLRQAGRPLVDRAKRSDRAALAGLPELLDRADSLSDPAVSGRFIAQRNAHEDLDRLAEIDRLSRSVGGVRPQASEPLRLRLSRAARDLADPARRERSVAALEALSVQVERYRLLPFEDELRRDRTTAVTLCAGSPAPLVAEIDLARANWADAWAEGRSSGPEAARLHDLWRLCRAMTTVATSTGVERDEAGRLSGWGGFHATRSTLGPALVDAAAKVRLAALAAVAPGPAAEADLRRLLESLERDLPVWLLAATLRTRLGSWLADRPGPPLGLLAAVREPPEPGAFGLSSRQDLAAIARGVRELEELRRDGRDDDAKALHLALSSVAARVLAALGEETGAPLATQPDLPGPETDGNRTGPDRKGRR
jgi:hypothetical protein